MNSSNYTTINGINVPEGMYPAWSLTEDEKNKSLKNKSLFCSNVRPSTFFKLTGRINHNIIQGNLQHINSNDFHRNIVGIYTYFSDFQERKPVYFTFDNITLYRLLEILPEEPLSFILQRIDSPRIIQDNRAFMIMPFGKEELNDFYFKSIKGFLNTELNISIYRADDFNGNDIIVETIYNQIEISEFIICETTYDNKNVFYELGYASALNKEILTIQNEKISNNFFFDRAHIRTITYNLDEIDIFHDRLRKSVIAIRDKVMSQNT
ncbi:MAG: hypothetical protein J0M05_13985 [Candidatus Kapabacteria bacterium]|jgi:hypothetical protein|nr:hypothetical protein [Candidatus Kapabacteria bacterium]